MGGDVLGAPQSDERGVWERGHPVLVGTGRKRVGEPECPAPGAPWMHPELGMGIGCREGARAEPSSRMDTELLKEKLLGLG